jgi:WD40 repeat protein
MTTDEQLDQQISRWLEAEAPTQMPDRVLRTTFERTRGSRQLRSWRALLRTGQVNRPLVAVAGLAVIVIAIASRGLYLSQPGVGGVAPTPTAEASPTATAARTSTPEATFVMRQPGDGQPLGWSRDGTRLLLQGGDGNLFVLHADGTKTQVTEQLSALSDIPGSSRPSGATISPDGSRVVFAGLTQDGYSCHYGALFTVSADGGPAALFWKSQRDGIVRSPTFSPDGTQIAFVDGYCDSDHRVWVANADGSDAHPIVSRDPLGGTHVHGLAWSPAGDRIALLVDGGTYTFATDGSDFQRARASEYCWPGSRC